MDECLCTAVHWWNGQRQFWLSSYFRASTKKISYISWTKAREVITTPPLRPRWYIYSKYCTKNHCGNKLVPENNQHSLWLASSLNIQLHPPNTYTGSMNNWCIFVCQCPFFLLSLTHCALQSPLVTDICEEPRWSVPWLFLPFSWKLIPFSSTKCSSSLSVDAKVSQTFGGIFCLREIQHDIIMQLF